MSITVRSYNKMDIKPKNILVRLETYRYRLSGLSSEDRYTQKFVNIKEALFVHNILF